MCSQSAESTIFIVRIVILFFIKRGKMNICFRDGLYISISNTLSATFVSTSPLVLLFSEHEIQWPTSFGMLSPTGWTAKGMHGCLQCFSSLVMWQWITCIINERNMLAISLDLWIVCCVRSTAIVVPRLVIRSLWLDPTRTTMCF